MSSTIKISKPDFYTRMVPSAGMLVLASNPRRFYATIVNTSDTDMWLYFGRQGIVGEGIFIAKNGFGYEIDRSNLWTGDIYAIHSALLTKRLSIFEGS